MSKGLGRLERAIGELFKSTKDRALSVADVCDHCFALAGAAPTRAQRLSATRAAHRILQRFAAAREKVDAAFKRALQEAESVLGRPPRGRGPGVVYFNYGERGIAVDKEFLAVMSTRPSWPAYQEARPALRREYERFGGRHGEWRATASKDRRLYFHPTDYPVRVWAVAIEPAGVAWADAEIVRIIEDRVHVRYRGEPARLSRRRLARNWTLWRNVYFTSSRTGYAARAFDEMWFQRYWRPGAAAPPRMQMPLAEAIRLLGVPANFTEDDVVAAFRRMAKRAHPDVGGSAELFRRVVEARDRLLATLGTTAAAPKMPEFAPKGVKLRYSTWRPSSPSQLGRTRRLGRG